jgi:glycine cleavage system H protein
MEGFTYQNIFETKGIEYLLIICFFAILIPFWIILSKPRRVPRILHGVTSRLSDRLANVPQGLFFSKFHTWAHLGRTGTATVGMDDLLLHLTGPVRYTPVKHAGDRAQKGELLAVLENNGNKLSILSPISGEVVEDNPVLRENPGTLNVDPYETGWMYRIRPASWIAETQSYYLAEKATDWSVRELNRFREWLVPRLAKYDGFDSRLVLQDGGELADGPLAELPAEAWQDFQETFIS